MYVHTAQSLNTDYPKKLALSKFTLICYIIKHYNLKLLILICSYTFCIEMYTNALINSSISLDAEHSCIYRDECYFWSLITKVIRNIAKNYNYQKDTILNK